MKAPPLLHSGIVHATNLLTGVLILAVSVLFFDWGAYGKVSLVIAASLLVTQIAVLGSPGIMVAELSKLDSKQHIFVLRAFNKRLHKPHTIIFLSIALLVLIMATFRIEILPNLSIYGMAAVATSALVSPYNKMIMVSLTLPRSYSKFVLLSVIKNVLIISFLGISIIFESQNMLLFSVAFAEVVLFPALIFAKHKIYKLDPNESVYLDHVSNGKEQISVFFITMYFELLGKYDFYIFSAFMNASTFGVYALISNVNESIQTYLGSVRTQITPYYSITNSNGGKELNQNFSLVRVTLLALVLIGCLFIFSIYQIAGNGLDYWPIVFGLLVASSLALFKTLIYGNVFIQRSQSIKFAKFGVIHLFVLSLLIFLVYSFFGLIPSLVIAVFINFVASKIIVSNIPSATETT